MSDALSVHDSSNDSSNLPADAFISRSQDVKAELFEGISETSPDGSMAKALASMGKALASLVSLISVLPDLMARANAEPITPFEPASWLTERDRHDNIERCLHYLIMPMYVVSWAVAAAAYGAQPSAW